MQYKDKEFLYREYVQKQRSMIDIATELSVSTMTVRKYIKRFGFNIRSKSEQRSISIKRKNNGKSVIYNKPPKNKLLADKKWLTENYVNKNKSLREIAALCGRSSRRGIVRALRYHDIPVRDLKDARSARSSKGLELRTLSNPEANDLSKIKNMYESGMSMSAIANKLNVGYTTIAHRLDKLGIKRRSPWEHRVGSKHSADTIKKMSDTASQQISNGTRSSYVNSTRPMTLMPDGTFIKMRSSYEKHYAEYLKSKNINFEYESKIFKLNDEENYVPDFYLPDTDEYVEIKGYLSEDQGNKYHKFRSTYPDIKWKMLLKEDLEQLGISVCKFKKIFLICGVSGSGKSWICNQLSDRLNYISFDSTPKMKHLELISNSDKDVLYDLPIKISTFIKRYSDRFDIRPAFIIEDIDVIKKRVVGRGGKLTKSMIKRADIMKRRNSKYGVFSGTSQEVLDWLKSQV